MAEAQKVQFASGIQTDQIILIFCLVSLLAISMAFILTKPLPICPDNYKLNDSKNMCNATNEQPGQPSTSMPVDAPRDLFPFGLAAIAPIACLAYLILKGRGGGTKVDFVRPLLPIVYVPKIIAFLNELGKYNPEAFGSDIRFVGLEGSPEDPKGGTIPRQVAFLFDAYERRTRDYTNRIRVRMTAEHEFYPIGVQTHYEGMNTRVWNLAGMIRLWDEIPVNPEYTVIKRKKGGKTKKVDSDTEFTDEIEQAEEKSNEANEELS